MRTRLPVKLKLAVVTAALTFGILCLFSVVIGAVAEQRIRAGFDDDLRASAADLVNRLGPRVNEADRDDLVGAGVGDAEVRVLDSNGEVAYPLGFPPLGSLESISDFADYRVVSRELTVSRDDAGNAPFGPALRRIRGRRCSATCSTPSRSSSVDRTVEPRAHLPRLRRARRHSARLHRRPVRGPARDAPDLRAHARGARGGAHPRPRRDAPQAARQRRGLGPGDHASRTCCAS